MASELEELLDELVASIQEQRALGQYHNNPQQLRNRLQEVLLSSDNRRLDWLTQPFLHAVLARDASARVLRPPSNDSRPLLFWLCQWKYLKEHYGWKGADDMVLLALRLGAAPAVEEEEGSILGAAIAHGSVHTVQHLIQAQKKLTSVHEWMYRETVLHDLWRKALDRACPRILQVILRYIPDTERLWMDDEQHVTAVEHLLHSLLRNDRYKNHSAEDLGQCLLQLLQKGVAYTPQTLTLLSDFLRLDQQNMKKKIAQLFFGNWLPQATRQKLKQTQQPSQNRPPQVCCAICLEDNPKPYSTNRYFFFPKNHNNPRITLYCGHAFCLDCIRQWGASEPELLRKTKTVELACPICRKPLAREFLSPANCRLLGSGLGDRRRNTLGLDSTQHYPVGPRGPQLLTKAQILLECQARGIPVDSFETAAHTLARQWNQVRRQRKRGPDILVDLGASRTLSPHYVAPKLGPVLIPIRVGKIPFLAGISGSSPYTVVTREAVELLGFQVRALASNEFQTFQPHFHEPSSSSSEEEDSDDDSGEVFVHKRPTRMQVIDEVTITLGDSKIEVRLRNAVVPCEDSSTWRPGIVLGLDFLESAAWTQTAVEVDIAGSIQKSHGPLATNNRRFMILLHGGLYIYRIADLELAQTMKEEFRYYAFNGRTFRTPLFHLQCNSNGKSQQEPLFFAVGHARGPERRLCGRRRAAFTECEWCCRIFHFFPYHKCDNPDTTTGGMIRCSFCRETTKEHVFYCDEECQKRAYKAHRHRHDEHYGMVVAWCRVVVNIVLRVLRRQVHVFVISFFIGLAASFLGSQAGPAPAKEMVWAQRSLLLPRVE